MSVSSFIRIERGTDRGPCPKTNKGLVFTPNPVNVNVSRYSSPNLGLVPASRYNCSVK